MRAPEYLDLHRSPRTGEFSFGGFMRVFIRQLQQTRVPQHPRRAQGVQGQERPPVLSSALQPRPD